MSVPIKGKPWLTQRLYVSNRFHSCRPEYLDQFRGQWIAWSEDGSKVVAHHDDLSGLEQQLRAKLLSTEEHICEWLPTEPEADCYLGGGLLDFTGVDPSTENEV